MVAVKAEGLRLEAEAITSGKVSMIETFPHGTTRKLHRLTGVSESIVSNAILVFQYAREYVDRVIAGTDNITLGDAHKEAEKTRDGLNSAEAKTLSSRQTALIFNITTIQKLTRKNYAKVSSARLTRLGNDLIADLILESPSWGLFFFPTLRRRKVRARKRQKQTSGASP
jgi:hypothetical protein